MVAIGTALAGPRRRGTSGRGGPAAIPASPWFYRALVAAAPLSVVALIAAWVTTEVGASPGSSTGDAHFPGGHRSGRCPRRLRDPGSWSTSALGAVAFVMLRRLATPPSERDLMLPELAAALTSSALTAYLVLGGADFGAGFWDLTAGGAQRGAPVRAMIKRRCARLGGQPRVAHLRARDAVDGVPGGVRVIASTLAIPLFLAALGIVLRGGAFALKGEAATIAEARALGAMFALSSVLVPFFLGAAAGAIAPARFRSATRPATRGAAGRERFRSSSACWPWSLGRTSRRCFWAPTRSEPGGRPGPRVPRAGARLGRRGGRARDRRPRRGELGRARALRRPHLRRGAGLVIAPPSRGS